MVFVVSFSSCLDIVAIEVRFGFDADGVKVCMPRRWMRRSLVRFPLRLAGILFHTLTLTHTNTYVSTHNQRRWTAAAPLNKNHELSTVGASNLVAGLAGGFTGSYIFSQVRCDVLCFLCFAWSSRLLLSVFSCASVRTLP